MAELYTEEELYSLNLPGFMSEATLSEALAQDTDWQTVLSLTLVNQSENGFEIQDGIRRRETNPTHPDVVSTPTGRVPKSVARILVEQKFAAESHEEPFWEIDEVAPQRPKVVTQLKGNIETLPNNEAILPFIAAGLLARKLGCAPALERAGAEKPFGTVSLSTVLAGFSYAADRFEAGQEIHLFEPLLMLGAIVDVADKSSLPVDSESYRAISWVKFSDYRQGFAGRAADMLIPGITAEDQVKVCVRGLCLATSNATIENPAHIAEHVLPAADAI